MSIASFIHKYGLLLPGLVVPVLVDTAIYPDQGFIVLMLLVRQAKDSPSHGMSLPRDSGVAH